ncbi:MAG: hypothetical protein JW769_01130 [Parachlamydiales bacterium]|nr:hypothetical protein [Parachlamydiales bacterium]
MQQQQLDSVSLERSEMIAQLQQLLAELKNKKDPTIAFWFIIRDGILPKIESISQSLQDGYMKFSDDINTVSRDYSEIEDDINNFKKDGKTPPSKQEIDKFKEDMTKLRNDVNKLYLDFAPIGPNTDPDKPIPFVPGNGQKAQWANVAIRCMRTLNMLDNTKVDANSTKIQDLLSQLDSKDPNVQAAAYAKLQTTFNDWTKDNMNQGHITPWDLWLHGEGNPGAGWTNVWDADGITDLNSNILTTSIQDANNKISQDSQVVNSCYSTAQNELKQIDDFTSIIVRNYVSS